jgi:arylsulfatase A-like enzyme
MTARLCVAALALAATVTAVKGAEPAPKPNIVFILADDLGYTDLGCYGSTYYETPQIDRMAARGRRFTDGYSCGPNCQPTRAALMSGQYGPRTGIYTVGPIDLHNWRVRPLRPPDNVEELPLDKVTLAQALKRAGYATGMFGKWHLGEEGPYHPARRGFDEAIATSGRHFDFDTIPKVNIPPGTYQADFVADKALDFIHRHRSEPFFLYLPFFEVHGPYQAKPELIAKFRKKSPAGGHHDPTYAAMIASLDESVGRILKALDDLNLSERTLVIFSSDNGGLGGFARWGIPQSGPTDNAPLHGGKGMLYEGGIRVPYIFLWPGTLSGGTKCDEPINSVDLYPTLLGLAGAQLPDGYTLDGVNYRSLLTSPSPARLGRTALYWHFPGYLDADHTAYRTTPAGAIRAGDWKLIEFFETGKLELYNLRDDLGETTDLAARMPDRVKELHTMLRSWRKAVGAPLPTPNPAYGQSHAGQHK